MGWGWWGGWEAHQILVTIPEAKFPFPFGDFGLGLGLSLRLVNKSVVMRVSEQSRVHTPSPKFIPNWDP